MSSTEGRALATGLVTKVADVPQVDLAKSMVSYKSREQKQLECLERIETLLINLVTHVLSVDEPVHTPGPSAYLKGPKDPEYIADQKKKDKRR
jgi:hypothetical protein